MFWVIIIVALVVGIIDGVAQSNQNAKNEESRMTAMTTALSTTPDFKPSTKVVGVKNLYTLAFDNDNQKMLYLVGSSKKLFNYSDIISVKLIEDNNTISQKSTGRTIGGALVGGVLAGGAGAIVGGLSGSSKQKSLHSSIKVKILFRNNLVPSLTITCFDAATMTISGKPVKEGDSEYYVYRQASSSANRIVDLISVIIDAVDRSNSAPTPNASSGSVADELAKLAILKEKGILTDEEFAEQKKKVLGGETTTSAPATPAKIELALPEEDPFDAELREVIASSGKLTAIKLYKERTGVDLATAKDYIDSLA